MPRGDGTGPQGQGPQTGRGLGPCGGNTTPDRQNNQNANPGWGQRVINGINSVFGGRRGGGRGQGRKGSGGRRGNR